jgi:transposase
MERKSYTKEFKLEAIRMSEESEQSVAQVARNLGIRPKLLYRWRSELCEEGPDEVFRGNGRLKTEDEEMRRLQRELERVRMERDILKKALSVFARPNS